MAEIAPANLRWMGTRISPDLGGVLSGIIGDRAHTSGYHRGWKYVPTSDYSRQLAEDKNANGEWACGIDMSFSADKMKLYTGRLKAAADRNDPRLKYVREFYGTLNGTTVYGRTHRGSADTTWESATSDKSHLWHAHLSILRQYADNKAVLQGILDVLMGKPLASASEELDMDKNEVFDAVWRNDRMTNPYGDAATNETIWGETWARNVARASDTAQKEILAVKADIVARDEADKVRDAANSAAVKALAETISKLATGGGSVDSAAIVSAVNTAAAATQTKVAELQNTVNARNAEIDQLRQRLAAAAQAEANALNS